jgi:putative oxidoreductase
MPWTDSEKNLSLFQVASWFPEDVAKFGIPFSIAPVFFAWMAAASEAIGGLLLAVGFLWISIYSIVIGSGKIGFDYLLSKKLFKK